MDEEIRFIKKINKYKFSPDLRFALSIVAGCLIYLGKKGYLSGDRENIFNDILFEFNNRINL